MKRLFILCILSVSYWLGNPAESIAAEERLIAVIMANSQKRYQEIHAVFVDNARTFCGDHYRIYVQRPNADVMSLRNSVRKATALGADLIVTYGPAASLAAKAESSPVPTLFADVYDPVNLELVSAKSLTGRNMTGIRGDAPLQALFKYFVETTRSRTLAVLFDTDSPVSTLQKAILEDSAKKKGITTILLPVDSQKDHLIPLQALPDDIDGLFLASSEHTENQLMEILAFAASRQLPVMTQRAETAELGAFMVLQTSIVEQGEKLAEIAGQVLAGSKTSEIPMYKPHQVEFVINLKIAREYGIQVPLQTLSVASRVIR
ncbi:MAG: ABC transporter substrate-binding protein [Desulfuromonadales bacterium]|nr:ABC transporter substrate-binding protein [Desulfuromonadales bacterium]